MDNGVAIIIAATIAISGYIVKGRIDIKVRQQQQKEERYIEMLTAMRGFYAHSQTPEYKQKFVNELNQAYLYASDDIIRKANKFLHMVKVKPVPSTEEEKKSALANLVLAMRKDLRKTKLVESDFETWVPT
jgi:hypothetical protein